MFDRLVFAVAMCMGGALGLTPTIPKDMTASELIKVARQKSVSNVCDKKRKTKKVKELCEKWGRHDGNDLGADAGRGDRDYRLMGGHFGAGASTKRHLTNAKNG